MTAGKADICGRLEAVSVLAEPGEILPPRVVNWLGDNHRLRREASAEIARLRIVEAALWDAIDAFLEDMAILAAGGDETMAAVSDPLAAARRLREVIADEGPDRPKAAGQC